MAEVREWVRTNETAREFLDRVAADRPPLLSPPLHRLPLRRGNVVEIAGPSPSAKSHLLLQVVVDCILPKEWKGVCYGGLEQPVMFIDLDCRFDILRLLQLLKLRISGASRSSMDLKHGLHDVTNQSCDEELIAKCLERFLYVRCYDTLEFLATLKTLSYNRGTKKEISKVRFMLIDSIGAYYWVDRASTSLPLGSNNRKMLSLQSMTEAVVCQIQNILQKQPMLVLVTKASIFADKSITNDIKRTFRRWSSQDAPGQNTMEKGPDDILHREYMPSAWQSFVTHRIFVRPSSSGFCAGNSIPTNEQIYLAQWIQPALAFIDKFVVRDAGIFSIP